MSEALKIIITAVAGIGVFVVGQIFQKWFIDPIQEQKKLIGKIVYALNYYANVQEGIAEDKKKEARQALRNLSSEVLQSVAVIPAYDLLTFFGWVPRRGAMTNVSIKLLMMQDLKISTTVEVRRQILKELKIDDYLPYSNLNLESYDRAKEETSPVKDFQP